MARLARKARHHQTFQKDLDHDLASMEKELHNPNECRIVLDLGTARLYLVYTLPGSDEFHEVYDWDNTGKEDYENAITFTSLYYLPEDRRKFWAGRKFLWGREVDNERRTLLSHRQDLDPRRHVQYFKLAIHATKTANWYDKELNEQARFIFGDLDVGVKQFALDFMDAVYEHLLHPITGHISRKQAEFGFQMKDVVLVFTMPSGWPIQEYEIFQQPAGKWGLEPTQIQYVSESDAVIRYWISKQGWRLRAIKTNSIITNVDIGAGTIVSLAFYGNRTLKLIRKDISIKRITSFNEDDPETSRMENALPRRGLNHGIERIMNIFEENIRSKLSDYPPSDAKIMAKSAALQFNQKRNNCEKGNFLDLPGWPKDKDFFVLKEEFTEPYRTAISAVIEVLETIERDLVKLGYGNYPMCILLSGGGASHMTLVDALHERFPNIPFHSMPSSELKKGCAKGGFLESRDRTNFTQHKFSRASYAIKCRQPCSAPPRKPDDEVEEPTAEETRMLELDPTAEKIYDKVLQRFHFKKDVNDWFAKLNDPLIWIPDNFVWRDLAVQGQNDLSFVDVLVEYNGHPGSGSFTIYDEENEQYKIQHIRVDLRGHLKVKDLKRANVRYNDYRPKLLEYCYWVELDENDRPIFFVIFTHPKDKKIQKVQVYQTGTLDLGRLEGHKNLEDPSFSSFSDSLSETINSDLPTTKLKNNERRYDLTTVAGSCSSTRSQNNHLDKSGSEPNIGPDANSSSPQLQATSTAAQVNPQLLGLGISKSGVGQCSKDLTSLDSISARRPIDGVTSTPSADKISRLHPDTGTHNNIKVFQEHTELKRRSTRQALSNVRAIPEALSLTDPNMKSRYVDRTQVKVSFLPRPKKALHSNTASKI